MIFKFPFISQVIIFACTSFLCSSWAQAPSIKLPTETTWASDSLLTRSPAVIPAQADKPLLQAERSVTTERILVGSGDVLFISVFGQPDMSAEVTVSESGQITLPLIGTMRVTDLPPAAIEKLIASRLRDGQYLKQPEVTLQVRQAKSQSYIVLGEVQRPGRYPLQGRQTLVDALAAAGGATPRADRVVQLSRQTANQSGAEVREEFVIPLDRLAERTPSSGYLELKKDDVVIVPTQKMFFIHGEVRRAGSYPLEQDMNVMRALSLGGGITERGSAKRLYLHRQLDDKSIIEIRPTLTTPLQSGDVLFVDERLF